MKTTIAILLLVLAGGCVSDGSVSGDGQTADRTVTINLKVPPPACTYEVVPDTPCAGQQPEDFCAKKGNKVYWELDDKVGDRTFFILFPDDSPMNDQCKYKSQTNAVKCNIKKNAVDGDYKYTVYINGCNNVLDPKIIIRNADRE